MVVKFREEPVEKATSYQIRTQSYKPDNDNSSSRTTMAYEEDESLAADEAAKKQGLADDHRSFTVPERISMLEEVMQIFECIDGDHSGGS